MLKSQARQQKSEDNFVNQKCLSSLKLSDLMMEQCNSYSWSVSLLSFLHCTVSRCAGPRGQRLTTSTTSAGSSSTTVTTKTRATATRTTRASSSPRGTWARGARSNSSSSGTTRAPRPTRARPSNHVGSVPSAAVRSQHYDVTYTKIFIPCRVLFFLPL